MTLEHVEYDFEVEYIKGREHVMAEELSTISNDVLNDISQKTGKILAVTTLMTQSTSSTEHTNSVKSRN